MGFNTKRWSLHSYGSPPGHDGDLTRPRPAMYPTRLLGYMFLARQSEEAPGVGTFLREARERWTVLLESQSPLVIPQSPPDLLPGGRN